MPYLQRLKPPAGGTAASPWWRRTWPPQRSAASRAPGRAGPAQCRTCQTESNRDKGHVVFTISKKGGWLMAYLFLTKLSDFFYK
jgi:hypothetical protein